MHHQPQNTHKIVLIFVMLGVIFLFLFTAIIVVNNRTFADKTAYKTILDNAKGLNSKPSIYFKGLEIGKVYAFRLNPQTNDIEVDFWIFDEYKSKIVKYSVLAGHQNTLLGDISSFELLLPSTLKIKSFEALADGDLVPHINSELGRAYVRNGLIAKQGDSMDSIIASVNTLLLNLQKEDNPDAGSLFRILDRVAKITDHLLTVSEALGNSSILPEAETAIKNGQQWLQKLPETMAQFDALLLATNTVVTHADQVLSQYSQPAGIVNQVTAGKVPKVLDNVNANLALLQAMLSDVHAEREQLVITVHAIQQVLDKLDKTLQGLNNNPLLKEGIEKTPQSKGIEMND